MTEDRRVDQSKSDRSSTIGPLRPTLPTPPTSAESAPVFGPAAPPPPSGEPVRPSEANQPYSAGTAAQAPPVAPAQAVTAPQPVAPAARPSQPVSVAGVEADEDSDLEEDEMAPTMIQRMRRLRPAPIILTVGSLGALFFLALAVTTHTTPLGVLMSAAVVTGLIFGADAIVASRATWRASQEGETGLALLLAFVGGVSSLVSLGAFAGTLVLILVLNSLG
jgi:hypothetical protein